MVDNCDEEIKLNIFPLAYIYIEGMKVCVE